MSRSAAVPLWGLAEIVTADGPQSCAMSHEDFSADAAAAHDLLDLVDAYRGASILVVSRFSESGMYVPLFEAAWRSGVIVSCADATAQDAYRVAMLTQALPHLAAVVGVNTDVLDGLGAAGHDVAEVFGTVATVAARPAACARLRAAGVPARLWAPLGPALAVECAARRGGHVGGAWRVAVDAHGALSVRSASDRACGQGPWRAAGTWSLAQGRCPCRRQGPRVAPLYAGGWMNRGGE